MSEGQPNRTTRFGACRAALVRAWARPGTARMVTGGSAREPLAAASTLHPTPVATAVGGLLLAAVGLLTRTLRRRCQPAGTER
jgi:hypothetical protein